jgi:predicted AAA+ superfamily ATPase
MPVPSKKEIMEFSPINMGGKEKLPEYKRIAFEELKEKMKTGLIVSVTGLRRVGKSTLIKQFLQQTKNSFYFSFDEKRYANPDALKKVIDTFISESENPIIALDEVFRVEDWAGILKRYHDQKIAKFIVSGSSSLFVKKGIESLSGRLMECYLPPLTFKEYLELKGERPEEIPLSKIFKVKKRYVDESEEFLKKGSFPEIVNMDEKTASYYIRTSTIEKIIFDDIPYIFHVEYPSKLYDLMKLCSNNSSCLFSEVNFSEALQISRHTISDYLLYLKEAYLIDILYSEGSFQKALKKSKKIFVKTASIYNSLSENPNVGQSAETAVYDKINFYIKKLVFYRDAQKREVDFVFYLPIEVKYQSTITTRDIENLIYYLKKRKIDEGIVITKDLFDERIVEGKKIIYIPLDVFLLANLSSL